MPKPSEIFDTPAATGFSRVGGNEEILEEAFAEYEYQNDLLTVSSAKKILRAILTTKDQEKEEAIRMEVKLFMETIQERANKIPANLLLNEVVNYAYDRLEALPTEDNK